MNSFWPSPIIFQIGPLAIHWYGLMYALTFLIAYLIFQYSQAGRSLPLTAQQKDNLLITLILGIIIGGRLGYILFYNLTFYLQNPLKILAVWEGGLSFHGGIVGTIIATWLFITWQKTKAPQTTLSFLQITDLAVLITPIGIMLGRLGNFINAELYGRISPTGQFCLHFPTDPANCRYPSQLFESATEGLLLGLIMFFLNYYFHRTNQDKNPGKPGQLSAIFAILYGIFRISMEFFREPDIQLGFISNLPGLNIGITMGQLLSAILIIGGLFILVFINIKNSNKTA